jgi:hypothetical protein
MKRKFTLVAVMALLVTLTVSSARSTIPVTEVLGQESRAVDVVICLDTSGSMEDLIDAARARVWDVIGELARMQPTPELRVGLLSFGTQAGGENAGWIVQHSDLTDDLDAVYASLMALTIEGGEEYVGRAIHTALEEMSWSMDWNALRILFVAGNESADQDSDNFDFRTETRAAQDRDIIVNAMYAGNHDQAIVEHWPEVARRGQGTFSAIDPSVATIQISTPHDDALLALNARLNQTYVPYGSNGAAGLANQVAQDSNASRLGVQSCSSRITAKGTSLYTNASWDLVDASVQEGFDIASVAVQELPESLQSMSREELAGFVAGKRLEREAIQTDIQALSNKREDFIKKVRAEELASSDLGEAMKQAIREQAMKKGFECDGC